APAMKFSFAERMIIPRGKEFFISERQDASSCSASFEKVFADSPCLSKVSQARPSLSFSQCQCFASTLASTRSMTSPCLQCFDQHRAAEAAADADRCHAFLLVVAFQRLQQMQHDARAARADRMAKGDRAPIHIQFVFIQRTERSIEAELLLA